MVKTYNKGDAMTKATTSKKIDTIRNRRGGLAVGNPHRWEDTCSGMTLLLDEIERDGVAAVIEAADERGTGEGDALRKMFVIARRLDQ